MSVEMRKQPAQKRSQKRIDRILLIAERLICEKGLSDLSVREVARQADANIATFYQYFPNRSALVRQIVEKYQELLHNMLKQGVADAEGLGTEAALALMQARTLEFYDRYPVVAEIWPGTHSDHSLRALNGRDNQINIKMLAGFVIRLNRHIGPEHAIVIATLILTTTAPVTRVSRSLPDLLGPALRDAQVRQLSLLIDSIKPLP